MFGELKVMGFLELRCGAGMVASSPTTTKSEVFWLSLAMGAAADICY